MFLEVRVPPPSHGARRRYTFPGLLTIRENNNVVLLNCYLFRLTGRLERGGALVMGYWRSGLKNGLPTSILLDFLCRYDTIRLRNSRVVSYRHRKSKRMDVGRPFLRPVF